MDDWDFVSARDALVQLDQALEAVGQARSIVYGSGLVDGRELGRGLEGLERDVEARIKRLERALRVIEHRAMGNRA